MAVWSGGSLVATAWMSSEATSEAISRGASEAVSSDVTSQAASGEYVSGSPEDTS